MKNLLLYLVILVFILPGCKTKTPNDQEIQKLLDRQVELQSSQEESLSQIEAELQRSQEAAAKQLQSIQDSLANKKDLLLVQRETKDKQIGLLEKNQQILAEKLRKGEEAIVASEKQKLQQRMLEYKDSTNLLKGELSLLDTNLDSIEKSIMFNDLQENRSGNMLESGIAEIDQQITMRENQKQQALKSTPLLKKRILISEKKIETYELERQMYLDESEDMLRKASQEDLEPYLKKVTEMDRIIASEKDNKAAVVSELQEVEEWIAGTDAFMADMQIKLKTEYNKQEIVEAFIASEQERLRKELDQIQSNRNGLISEQEKLSGGHNQIELQIASLDKEIELIQNKEMSDILEQQALLEQSEADLAEEEIQLLKEAPSEVEIVVSSDSSSEELGILMGMNDELDSLKEMIQTEKTEITKTRKDLAERRAEAATQRARFGRTISVLGIAIIIGVIALLTLFFYLGKKGRKSS